MTQLYPFTQTADAQHAKRLRQRGFVQVIFAEADGETALKPLKTAPGGMMWGIAHLLGRRSLVAVVTGNPSAHQIFNSLLLLLLYFFQILEHGQRPGPEVPA
jgi:hypothetical protein